MQTTPPRATSTAAHIGYQIDRSFGPPMLYIEGDRRDRPPLITINVAHEHELLVTDEQARALRAALDEVLSPAAPCVVFAGHDEALKSAGDRRWTPVQTSAVIEPGEQHSMGGQMPRIYATAAELSDFETVVGYFSDSKVWRCPCRWDRDDQCWRAVGPTGGWLVFSSIERFNAWRNEHGATWERWARP